MDKTFTLLLMTHLETDLDCILELSIKKETENEDFVDFIKTLDGNYVDATVHQLNKAISSTIDCTLCGNCCKSLMILVDEEEADLLCNHLNQTREIFEEKYVEKGSSGLMIMNQIPCHFLSENKCTVYEQRFAGCNEFPAMHLPNFKDRLFTTFMHYNRCPIIYNVVEQLKVTL